MVIFHSYVNVYQRVPVILTKPSIAINPAGLPGSPRSPSKLTSRPSLLSSPPARLRGCETTVCSEESCWNHGGSLIRKKQKQEPLEMFSCSPFQAQHEAILMTYGPGFRNRSFQGCAEKMSTSPWMGFFHIPVVSRSTGDDFRKTKMWSVFIGCKLLLSGFIFLSCQALKKIWSNHDVGKYSSYETSHFFQGHISLGLAFLMTPISTKSCPTMRATTVLPVPEGNWGWVKTLVPSEPQKNSGKWMFIPLKMYL